MKSRFLSLAWAFAGALPVLAALAGIALSACSSGSAPPAAGTGGTPPSDVGKGTLVSMDFSSLGKSGAFYASPFPTDARGGSAGVGNFPNPHANVVAASVLALLKDEGTAGFGLTSGIFFALSAPIDATSLPSFADSMKPTSPIFLLGIDPASPDYLARIPVSAGFLADGGPYGAPNLLGVLPLQGVPLRPKTRYAVVVTQGVHDAKGKPLGIPVAMAALAGGMPVPGLEGTGLATYQAALAALRAAKVDVATVAGLAAFTTGSPEDALGKVVAAMIASPPAPDAPWTADEVFPTFCVYHTTIEMPEYQSGQPPYNASGGTWEFDASGAPVLQRQEEATFVVTIPRSPMPAAGYPAVVFSRTGAGGNRPLVDRGPMATNGGPPINPGTGPALYFAAAGYAGSEIDGPLGGLRNPTNGNEDFLIFNVGNPGALRDNVRQSAAELALQAHVLEHVSVDVSACPGAVAPNNLAKFDVGTMALMGHSMGATISPLALAAEPRFRAGLLSGCGGSWIENVVYKQLPPPALKGIAQVLVGVAGTGYQLTEHDPLLTMFQWAAESADPPVYARRITTEPLSGAPRNVLMMQGIVDHYIMPPIADAMSVALHADLAGPELDDTPKEIAGLAPLGPRLPLVGRHAISLPAGLNLTSPKGTVTAIVTQHPSDGIEDGHEVVFQTDPPKHEYRCLLQGLLTGKPIVPASGTALAPCP